MSWRIEDVEVGDYISTQIVNKQGDGNLDGAIISGIVKDLEPAYGMVRLDSGWCCHTKDILLKYEPRKD